MIDIDAAYRAIRQVIGRLSDEQWSELVQLRTAPASEVKLPFCVFDGCTGCRRCEPPAGREAYVLGPGAALPDPSRPHSFRLGDVPGVCAHCPLPKRNAIHQGA